jgi:hypothetical protein
MKKLCNANVLIFACGGVASLIGACFLKSKTAHKLAVRGVANGMRLKNDALRKAEAIREEAQDIYEEAKRESEGECHCCSCKDNGPEPEVEE